MTTLFYYRSQRSCGKVMFLHVSDSVHRGGVSVPACTTGYMTRGVSGSLSRGSLSIGGFCPGVSLSTGVSVQGVSVQRISVQGVSVGGFCLWVSVWGGVCLRGALSRGSLSRGFSAQGVSVWGVSVQEGLCVGSVLGSPPPYGNEQAVRILLECILVYRILMKHNIAARFHVILF